MSGRSQTDGPADVTDTGATEANRALVTEFGMQAGRLLRPLPRRGRQNRRALGRHRSHPPDLPHANGLF
jgi:hypothetical protein